MKKLNFEKLSNAKFVAMEKSKLNQITGGRVDSCCIFTATGMKDGTTKGEEDCDV